MPIEKDKIFNKIDSNFKEVQTLIYRQFYILDLVIADDLENIPAQIIQEFHNNEDKIDKFEVQVNENIIQFIVLHQPVASDLRQIIAFFRMILNIERIGDQLNNIFKSIKKTNPASIPTNEKEGVLNMLSMSRKMLRKALDSFENYDKDNAIWTIKNDELVDKMQDDLMNISIKKYSSEDDQQVKIQNIINMNSILSNIERIADNATNIAEASIYYQEGLDIRHKELKSIF